MKRTFWIIALISATAFTALPALAADHDNGGRGKLFRQGHEKTIHGRVMRISEFTGPRGRFVGVTMVVRTEDGPVPVFLGPRGYLRYNNFRIQPGERVTVHGAMADVRDHRVLLAQRVRHGGEVLLLRNGRGTPLWAAHDRG
jgi:hypothetical protein